MQNQISRAKMSKTKKRILTTIYGLVLLFLCLVFCFQLISPSLSLKVFGFQTYIISYTGSMEPDLSFGDLIVVKKYSFDDLKENDIITFLAYTREGEQVVVTHQIVEIVKVDGVKMLRTKGKANDQPDLIPVTEDGMDQTNTYIGKYAFKSTAIGTVITFLKSPQGLLVTTINFCSVILIHMILQNEPKRRLEKRD